MGERVDIPHLAGIPSNPVSSGKAIFALVLGAPTPDAGDYNPLYFLSHACIIHMVEGTSKVAM
jgi:hypothetical protein